VQALGVRHRGAARHNAPVIAVIDCFMGGFSLCGALLHPTALFSAEAYLDETDAEDLRKRNFTATARHHAAREVNRLVPDFQLTMTNDGPMPGVHRPRPTSVRQSTGTGLPHLGRSSPRSGTIGAAMVKFDD
jgi:hypothetical protein